MSPTRSPAHTLRDQVETRQSVTLTVPMPPNIANARQHWRVKLNEKQDYWGTLNLMQQTGVFPKPIMPAPAKASIHARMFLGAAMDHDNAVARLKWLMDWLVGNKYLAGDKPKQLEWQGFPEQIVKRDGNYRVEITITNLSP